MDKQLRLNQLLDHCGCPNSPNWEWAWREFLNRYLGFISDKVRSRCSRWDLPRLRRQFAETVNDIIGEVLKNLCKNNCRALRNFRYRDNEHALLSWLRTICNNTTDTVIIKQFNKSCIDADIEDVQCNFGEVEIDISWELYENVVKVLRTSGKNNKKQRERDIDIFTLYIWEDYSGQMIQNHPRFKNLGARVVDNVIYRLRNELRNASTLFN